MAFCHHFLSVTIAAKLTACGQIAQKLEKMKPGIKQRSFAEEFENVLSETDTTIRRLSRLSGVPRRTLENWLYGRSQKPRHVEPILMVARELHLPAGDANRLLLAAGYPTIEELVRNKSLKDPQLVEDWIVAPNTLIGQQQTGLASQHNLPGANTPFLGRAELGSELQAMLRNPELRLITISGLGGVGKTRLALETARAMTSWFDHGVYFIPLDNVGDAQGIWEAILSGLGIPGNGMDSAQKLVEEYVRNKQLLLLLDNFEHLLAHTDEISRLLTLTQRLKMLVTSRQALDMRAEQLFPIGGLSFAAGQDSPAYELFVRTARRRVPGYKPSPMEAADIIQLCTYVDGLPLAIELAATWSDVLSPSQIMDHLSSDLREVWHSTSDRPERQKSLWELFDYSWRMLTRPEQEAAMRLSILRGSFMPQTALAVANCEPAVLKLLIQTSVIGRTTGSRLMIHPLVRQFLAAKAAQAGFTITDLERRFTEIILDWVSTETGKLRETFRAVHFQNLHSEWQHIDRSWWLAVRYECYDLLDTCWDILFYFEARGNWGQGYAFFERMRQLIPVSNGRMQARLDEAQALLASRLNDFQGAARLAKQSLVKLDALGVDAAQDRAGAYARLILLSAEYAFKQADLTDVDRQRLRAITAGYLDKFGDVTLAMADGVKHCMHKEFVEAGDAFANALDIAGEDAYCNSTIRCFYAISLDEQGELECAREQFAMALARGLELDTYPAVVTATYELRLLEGDDPDIGQCREAMEELALRMGSRLTVGRVAITNAIQYLNLGLLGKGTQVMRIGAGMVWNEVDTAERRRILSIIAQAYLAFGLAKTAPQVLALIAPKGAPARI